MKKTYTPPPFPDAEEFARFFETVAAGLRSGNIHLHSLSCSSELRPWNNYRTHNVNFEFIGNAGTVPNYYANEPAVQIRNTEQLLIECEK